MKFWLFSHIDWLMYENVLVFQVLWQMVSEFIQIVNM